MGDSGSAINKTDKLYPYWFYHGGRKCCLLWIARKSARDGFMVNQEGKPLCVTSKRDLEGFFGLPSERIDWTQEAKIDFDEFWSATRGLRVNRASSTMTCRVLLEGWNFLEDLLRTLHRPEWLKRLNIRLMKRIYDKLYFGNNLAAVTPAGQSYNPLWTREEIVLLRRTMRELWKELAHAGELPT